MTMKKLFENWRKWNKTLNEDWYSDEHETRADKEFADSMDPGATHSSYSEDPEFDQIYDISLDSLESGPMGRNPNLDISDIARRLEAQSFDVEINADGLDIDGKYQIGLMRDLPPHSRRQISQTPFGLSYIQDGAPDALPKQSGMGRAVNEGAMAPYRITFNDKVDLNTVQELSLEVIGVDEKISDNSKEGFAEIAATPKGIKRVVDIFKKNGLPTDVITNAKGENIL